ncbi:hypothetical protein [Phaeocystidibacter luteus]|uniref:DUF2490 domain-containing protein n=1 Tax=Phaeocystidibacter luteus TaxID=911197 RepID=A0A6N6RLZ0_9FLAO|nr:hypothetical protein [Phaeocystidibacter luteus]KAB2814634.1 hypothetical protein F8C67_02515 [Phaeocystidibacter luteus]
MKFWRTFLLVVLLLSTWTVRGQINYDSWADVQLHWGDDEVQQVAEMSIRHRWKYIDFTQQLFRYSYQHTISDTYRRDRGGAIVPASVNYQLEFDLVELRYFDGWRFRVANASNMDIHLYLRNEVRGFFEWESGEYDGFSIADRIRVRPELGYTIWRSRSGERVLGASFDVEFLGTLVYHPQLLWEYDLVNRYRAGLNFRISPKWQLEATYTLEQSLDGGADRSMGRMAVSYFL